MVGERYRLVWFQHFHKAAGTSITATAQVNGESLWPQHKNANPLNQDGSEIELWNFSADRLTEFIDQCQANKVTFVACEWGLPEIGTLADDPRVTLITCLRNPLDRYVSNFYFDLHLGFTPATSLEAYRNTRQRVITMDNYYCRMLSKLGNDPRDLIHQDYLLAQSNLERFDHAIDLANGIGPLYQALGWTVPTVSANQSSNSIRQKLSLLLRGQWRLLHNRMRYSKQLPSAEFKREFEQRNKWDYDLISSLTERT